MLISPIFIFKLFVSIFVIFNKKKFFLNNYNMLLNYLKFYHKTTIFHFYFLYIFFSFSLYLITFYFIFNHYKRYFLNYITTQNYF